MIKMCMPYGINKKASLYESDHLPCNVDIETWDKIAVAEKIYDRQVVVSDEIS